jgi:hypothetical protein
MKLRFQIGSNRPLANRKARMFCAGSLPRKWSMRKICSSLEHLVQRAVEVHGAGVVGAEGLLHHDARALHQPRGRNRAHRRKGGLGRNGEVVQAQFVVAGEFLLGA